MLCIILASGIISDFLTFEFLFLYTELQNKKCGGRRSPHFTFFIWLITSSISFYFGLVVKLATAVFWVLPEASVTVI